MPRLATSSILLLAACIALACVAGSRLPSPAPSGELSASVEQLPWTTFTWVSTTVGGRTLDHAAVLVPFRADTLGAETYFLQLDTGADVGIWLYTAPLNQLLARSGSRRDTTQPFELPRGEIAGYAFAREPVNVRNYAGDSVRTGDPHPKVGTLGIEFFRERVLLIDFPQERVAIVDSAALPRPISDAAHWVPASYRYQKLFIPIELNGVTYDGFFYDSGASLFPVSTIPELWRTLTGRSEEDPANERFVARSFGQGAVFSGAPITGVARVAGVSLERPTIYTLAHGPAGLDLRDWPFPVEGLIGNELFRGTTVILDLPRRRFGVLPDRR